MTRNKTPYILIFTKYLLFSLFLSGALYWWGFYSIPYSFKQYTGVDLTLDQVLAINNYFLNARTPAFVIIFVVLDYLIYKIHDKFFNAQGQNP
jgi:hypothetical protein